jgi:hypothetical protein
MVDLEPLDAGDREDDSVSDRAASDAKPLHT